MQFYCTWLLQFYAITNKASIMANSWEPKVSVSHSLMLILGTGLSGSYITLFSGYTVPSLSRSAVPVRVPGTRPAVFSAPPWRVILGTWGLSLFTSMIHATDRQKMLFRIASMRLLTHTVVININSPDIVRLFIIKLDAVAYACPCLVCPAGQQNYPWSETGRNQKPVGNG